MDDNDKLRVGYLLSDGYSFDDAMEKYEDVIFYADMTMRQVAESLVDDGCFGEIPESLQYYIDYDAIARDLGIDGYTETSEGVFCH
jgi:antirestriction protein